jgi:hypothetical protein
VTNVVAADSGRDAVSSSNGNRRAVAEFALQTQKLLGSALIFTV